MSTQNLIEQMGYERAKKILDEAPEHYGDSMHYWLGGAYHNVDMSEWAKTPGYYRLDDLRTQLAEYEAYKSLPPASSAEYQHFFEAVKHLNMLDYIENQQTAAFKIWQHQQAEIDLLKKIRDEGIKESKENLDLATYFENACLARDKAIKELQKRVEAYAAAFRELQAFLSDAHDIARKKFKEAGNTYFDGSADAFDMTSQEVGRVLKVLGADHDPNNDWNGKDVHSLVVDEVVCGFDPAAPGTERTELTRHSKHGVLLYGRECILCSRDGEQ